MVRRMYLVRLEMLAIALFFSSGAGFGTAMSFYWLLDVSLPAVLLVVEILEL